MTEKRTCARCGHEIGAGAKEALVGAVVKGVTLCTKCYDKLLGISDSDLNALGIHVGGK